MKLFFEDKPSILQSYRTTQSFEFPLHVHAETELLYIHSGEFCIDYPDRSFILSEGDFAIIFPYTIHGYSLRPIKADYSLAIGRRDLYKDFDNILLNYHPETPVIKCSTLHKDIPSLMNDLAVLNDCSNNELLVKALLSLILARALPLMTLKPNSEMYSNSLVAKVIRYISDNYKENISLDTIAESMGISRYAVSRLFSSTIKINFVDYVNRIRIDNAKQLLDTTNESILDIALDCGFGSLRTFNRVFKEQTGTTPLKYRKKQL